MKRGLTLLELVITIVMFSILTLVAVYIFRAIILSWASQEKRIGINISLDRGIEEMARELRKAKDIAFLNNYEIRFMIASDEYYIYYLYNPSDTYPPMPPDFEASYELKKAALQNVSAGDLTKGSFAYGAGKIIINDVLPPAATELSISGNVVTLDISVSRGLEIIRSRTEVRPRNL